MRNEEDPERMIASLKKRRKAFLESSNYFYVSDFRIESYST